MATLADDHVFRMLIDGELVDGVSTFGVVNPSTAKEFARAPHADKALVDRAVDAAHRAFPAWSALTIEQRKEYMSKAIEAYIEAVPALSNLLVKEQGKPFASANGEVQFCIQLMMNNVEIEVPVEVYSETETTRVECRRRPLGVVVGITPWNFPLFCSVQKWAAALVLGNTFILKPSPYTPLTALYVGEVLQKVFPPGVFNVVSGDDFAEFKVGAYLVNHPKVRKISFTGSTATGKRILAESARDVKRLTLEMGGNDAAIVRGDCDPVAIAPKVFTAAFNNSGQVCVAVKRCFVQRAIYDQFCDEIVKVANATKVGDGFEEGVVLGPLNNKMQLDRVSMLVEDARTHGANIRCGGKRVEGKDGFFYEPTIISHVAEGIKIVDEEQFGPVLPIIPFDTDEEAVSRANDTEFGLGGSVWSADIAKANELASQIVSGTVWVNDHQSVTGAPFGGFKSSGIGRELGKADVVAFTECQTFQLAKVPTKA